MMAGRDWLHERVAGLGLRASLATFFQANHEVTEIMAGLVREWTREVRGGILDLYAGVGVLGLAAAAGGEPAWLAGIEESEGAVADARINAAAVPRVRSEWHAGPVEAVLPGLAARLAAVIALRAPTIIYVSCDPATFARDLGGLKAAGWELETLVPLDMFPQTWHIELAARFRISS
jgi:23S rRNA (uracil1939-C5)-methyltransferase